MKKLIMSAALGASAMLLSACGDGAEETDTATAEADAVDTTAAADAAASGSSDWPAGTRIVQEGETYYRVGTDGTRVAIPDGTWRVETVDGVRYRVDERGTRVRIDDQGVDVDLGGPDVEGVDVDLGTNRNGNLDLDVSTDGTDASPDDR